MKKILNNKKWIVFSILIVSFLIIVINLFNNNLIGIDAYVYNKIQIFNSNNMTTFFKLFTELSGSIFLVILCVLLFMLFKNKKYWVLIIINLVTTVILNQCLKNIFLRQRPLHLMLVEESGYSFPSGHSMASMSFYGFLIFLIWQSKINKNYKWILTVMFSVIIILIGISRIYLGVHYFSDVLAGFCISLAYLIVFITISKKILNKE